MKKVDEKILVVKRSVLLQDDTFQGFLPCDSFEKYEKLVVENNEFLWRSAMEQDPCYKQIIPYLVFRHNDTYFLMQRKDTATEQRLQNKYSLGIGGHIREEDILGASIANWAKREFMEEVEYSGDFSVAPLGLLNDDSNAVGQVHIGFVFLFEGKSPFISIKSELKNGTLLTLDQMAQFNQAMETWSQLVYTYLLSTQKPQNAITHMESLL